MSPSAGSLLLFLSSAQEEWFSREAKLQHVKEWGWKSVILRVPCVQTGVKASSLVLTLSQPLLQCPPERYLPPHEKLYGPVKDRQATLTFVPQVGTKEKEYEIRKSWRRARECVFRKHVICNCANSDVFVSPIFCFPVVCITLDWNIRCCFCEFLNPILSDDVYECASDGCFPAPFCCLN